MTEILKPKQYIIGDLKLERAREKLRNALAIAPLDRFLRMLWCAEALRTERKAAAAPFIRFAPEAAYQDIRSEHAIHPWELETLATQALLVERKPLRRFYTCDNIATVGMFVNLLRNLENEEFRVESERIHILNEMHRIGQRQFPWQRGNANMPDFYRSLYLYGQGSCAEYFALSYNITVSEFSLLGFALFAMFLRAPNVELPLNLIDIDLNTEKVEAGLLLLAVHISQSANLQRKLVSQGAAAKWPIAYQPSVLRRSPILKMGRGSETLIAPLPNLVLQRVTFELYYDIIALSGALLNEVAERFERYCADYIRSMMPAFSVDREFKYPGSRKGTTFDSPEVLLEQDDILTVIIECKATKLTISAKFSDSPTEDAHQRYAEIARGVYQIWRFFAHTRMELTGRKFDEKTAGVVLTLDTWLVMGPVLRDHVMDVANALADADQDILDVDRRPVAFAAIQDFERLLSTSDETEVRAAIAASHQDRFLGWLLPSVASELNGTSKPAKPYPFSPENLVPWWSKFAD